MSDLETAVDDAVATAKERFEAGEKNPLDHGFAHMEVDGRTRLATALAAHDAVDAEDSGYVTIEGVSRYLTPQQAAYRAFRETLKGHGVDVNHVRVRGRLD